MKGKIVQQLNEGEQQQQAEHLITKIEHIQLGESVPFVVVLVDAVMRNEGTDMNEERYEAKQNNSVLHLSCKMWKRFESKEIR